MVRNLSQDHVRIDCVTYHLSYRWHKFPDWNQWRRKGRRTKMKIEESMDALIVADDMIKLITLT